jgi:peptide/nickel transport system permease protein
VIRFVARRLAILLTGVGIVHFLGFAYAHRAAASFQPVYLRQPFASTYQNYLMGMLRGDFGQIPTTRLLLQEILLPALTASLGLLTLATLLSLLAGLSLGFLAARSEPVRVSRWMTPLGTFGLAMPSFYLGSLFIVGYIYYALWAGPRGFSTAFPIVGFGWDLHLLLPTVVLMVRPTVQIAQVTAELLTAEFTKQYVLTARSFGHPWRAIRFKHAFRNVLPSAATTASASLRLLLGELVLVEWLFKWPGIGRLIALALVANESAAFAGSSARILYLHPPLVAALLAFYAGLFLLIDLVAELICRLADPRLRSV